MAFDTSTTLVGNLSEDPTVHDLPGGGRVVNLLIITNPRVYDRETGQWKDGESVAVRCNIWRPFVENVVASLHKGTRVIATGHLKTNRFTDSKGVDRDNLEMDLDAIGPDLRFARAVVTRNVQTVMTKITSDAGPRNQR